MEGSGEMAERYAVVIVTYNRLALLKECIRCVEMQTVPVAEIIIVNNASTDGTVEFLAEKERQSDKLSVVECHENIGGAGGFHEGIAKAVEEDADLVLLIDDDAMLGSDYMERILEVRKKSPAYHAFAGAVMTDGEIDTFHRKNFRKYGLKTASCALACYQQDSFECDMASFCGIIVETSIVKKIGLPLSEYFIWHDDTEYCLRINKFTKILVVPQAILIHKTSNYQGVYPRKYDWREYYGIRNRILYVKRHGTLFDLLLTRIDIFWNVQFRNWLFGLVRRSGYDWAYERRLVREALENAEEDQVKNVIIERERPV